MEIKKFLIKKFGPNYQGALLLIFLMLTIAFLLIILDLFNFIKLTNGNS